MKALGRRRPSDWRHVERYPVTAVPRAAVAGTSGVLGINWYSEFDYPERDGTRYWIGRSDLGSIRGGHAICARAYGAVDLTSWWEFYDQGREGSCVGFSCARVQTLNNRQRFAARDLYAAAQLADEYSDTPPAEGTSVRAGMEVMRTKGLERVYGSTTYPWDGEWGIDTYRWATNWDDVRAALGLPDSSDGVPLLNSWGRDYPHIVYLTDEAGARLLAEDGEFAIPTDR